MKLKKLDPDSWNIKRGKIFYACIIAAHLTTLFWLLSYFSWPVLFAGLFGFMVLSKLGGDIGFHRYFSHGAFETSDAWQWIMLACGTFLGFGSSVEWTGLHTTHHAHTDGKDDPHSPHQLSPWRVYFHAYFHDLKIDRVNVKKLRKALEDPKQALFHYNFLKIYFGYVALSIVLSLLFASWLPLIGMWAMPVMLSFHSSALVDVICHKWGYQTYTNAGNSRNNLWLNFVLLGNGMHNNHHGRPRDYYIGGSKWYEFDVWGRFIQYFMVKKTK